MISSYERDIAPITTYVFRIDNFKIINHLSIRYDIIK